MCARYSLTKEGLVIRIGEFEVTISITARYNIAPAQKATVIVPGQSGFQATEMTWGWKPVWSKQLLINAQSETLLEKPTFKKYLGNRCLIPADGFYEWTADKTPIRFTQENDDVFCFAGLYMESTTQPCDVPVVEKKFLILTTSPNQTVARIHNRMPLIVQPNHYQWWLGDGDMFELAIKNPDRDKFNFCPVQKSLNNVRNEGAELIRPSLVQKSLI